MAGGSSPRGVGDLCGAAAAEHAAGRMAADRSSPFPPRTVRAAGAARFRHYRACGDSLGECRTGWPGSGRGQSAVERRARSEMAIGGGPVRQPGCAGCRKRGSAPRASGIADRAAGNRQVRGPPRGVLVRWHAALRAPWRGDRPAAAQSVGAHIRRRRPRRTLVVLEADAEATLLSETASSDPLAVGLHCGAIEIVVGPATASVTSTCKTGVPESGTSPIRRPG